MRPSILKSKVFKGLPIAFILEKALDEGRVLLTHDLDFAELLAASGGKAPSVIVFRQMNGQVNRRVLGFPD